MIGGGACSSIDGSEVYGNCGQLGLSVASMAPMAPSQPQQQLVALCGPGARVEGDPMAVNVGLGVGMGMGQNLDYLSLVSTQSLLVGTPTSAGSLSLPTTGDQQQTPPPPYSAAAAALEAYRCS